MDRIRISQDLLREISLPETWLSKPSEIKKALNFIFNSFWFRVGAKRQFKAILKSRPVLNEINKSGRLASNSLVLGYPYQNSYCGTTDKIDDWELENLNEKLFGNLSQSNNVFKLSLGDSKTFYCFSCLTKKGLELMSSRPDRAFIPFPIFVIARTFSIKADLAKSLIRISTDSESIEIRGNNINYICLDSSLPKINKDWGVINNKSKEDILDLRLDNVSGMDSFIKSTESFELPGKLKVWTTGALIKWLNLVVPSIFLILLVYLTVITATKLISTHNLNEQSLRIENDLAGKEGNFYRQLDSKEIAELIQIKKEKSFPLEVMEYFDSLSERKYWLKSIQERKVRKGDELQLNVIFIDRQPDQQEWEIVADQLGLEVRSIQLVKQATDGKTGEIEIMFVR